MIFAETDPNDIFNQHLRHEALGAQERGHGISIWHGTDEFSGEDVEVLIILETRSGAIAIGDKVVACQVGEQGNHVILAPKNPARGRILIDIDSESLPMNLERTGCEAYNDGRVAHVRLWDRLLGEDILKLDGDEVHDLVASGELNTQDYHSSAFAYAKSIGLM